MAATCISPTPARPTANTGVSHNVAATKIQLRIELNYRRRTLPHPSTVTIETIVLQARVRGRALTPAFGVRTRLSPVSRHRVHALPKRLAKAPAQLQASLGLQYDLILASV